MNLIEEPVHINIKLKRCDRQFDNCSCLSETKWCKSLYTQVKTLFNDFNNSKVIRLPLWNGYSIYMILAFLNAAHHRSHIKTILRRTLLLKQNLLRLLKHLNYLPILERFVFLDYFVICVVCYGIAIVNTQKEA